MKNKLIIFAVLILSLFMIPGNLVKADDKLFDVAITGITSRKVTGSASNREDPSFTDDTATFKTNLTLPGDSMTYEITVRNRGSIEAILNQISTTETENPAIIFSYSGISEGDTLSPGAETKFEVTVTYNSETTTQPANLVSDLTIALNYEQNGEAPIVTPPGGMVDLGGDVKVPATSAYASITVILLGLLCIIVSIIVTKRMTESKEEN